MRSHGVLHKLIRKNKSNKKRDREAGPLIDSALFGFNASVSTRSLATSGAQNRTPSYPSNNWNLDTHTTSTNSESHPGFDGSESLFTGSPEQHTIFNPRGHNNVKPNKVPELIGTTSPHMSVHSSFPSLQEDSDFNLHPGVCVGVEDQYVICDDQIIHHLDKKHRCAAQSMCCDPALKDTPAFPDSKSAIRPWSSEFAPFYNFSDSHRKEYVNLQQNKRHELDLETWERHHAQFGHHDAAHQALGARSRTSTADMQTAGEKWNIDMKYFHDELDNTIQTSLVITGLVGDKLVYFKSHFSLDFESDEDDDGLTDPDYGVELIYSGNENFAGGTGYDNSVDHGGESYGSETEFEVSVGHENESVSGQAGSDSSSDYGGQSFGNDSYYENPVDRDYDASCSESESEGSMECEGESTSGEAGPDNCSDYGGESFGSEAGSDNTMDSDDKSVVRDGNVNHHCNNCDNIRVREDYMIYYDTVFGEVMTSADIDFNAIYQ